MWSDKIKSLRDITTTRLVHCRLKTMVSSDLWSLRMVGAREGNVQSFHHSGASIIPAGPAPLTLIIQGKGKWYGAIQLKPLALLPNSRCDLQLSRILIIGVPHNIKRTCVQSFARGSLFSLIFLAHWILAFGVTLEKRFISEIEAQLKKVPIGNGESLCCTQLCKKKKCQVAVEIGTRQSSKQQVVWSGKRAKQRHFASARSKQRTSFISGRHELPEFFSFLTDIN